jgi:hypothetical protein
MARVNPCPLTWTRNGPNPEHRSIRLHRLRDRGRLCRADLERKGLRQPVGGVTVAKRLESEDASCGNYRRTQAGDCAAFEIAKWECTWKICGANCGGHRQECRCYLTDLDLAGGGGEAAAYYFLDYLSEMVGSGRGLESGLGVDAVVRELSEGGVFEVHIHYGFGAG